MPDKAILQVRDLHKHFRTNVLSLPRFLGGSPATVIKAVSGVSFELQRGSTLALVGESGSGKSTVARMIVGAYPPTGGQIIFEGQELALQRTYAQRRRLNIIFQDPYSSLNPRWNVRSIIAEPLVRFALCRTRREIGIRVAQLLEEVGLSESDGTKFPHEFSGGQRQRISIARALASEPELIVCDEPTSALDMSVQAQILNLMSDLQKDRKLSLLFISHNLAVVRHMARHVVVMNSGRVVESGSAADIFERPRHSYTRMLLAAVPRSQAGRSADADLLDADLDSWQEARGST